MSFNRFIFGLIIGAYILMVEYVSAEEAVLSPFANASPVALSAINVDNQEVKAWQTSSPDEVLTFKPQEAWNASVSSALYLEVTYLDQGYGHLKVSYQGTDGKLDLADKCTHAYLLDSGK